MGRKSVVPRIEKRFGKPIDQVIERLYSQGNLEYVAKSLGISLGSASNYLKRAGIKKKPRAEYESTSDNLILVIRDFITSKEIGGKTEATLEFYEANLKRFVWWLENHSLKTA